jgi:FtsH-binding integral membrane protein
MPFKIFVVSAGVFGFSMKRLALTLLVARGLRYAFWAAMGAFYGDEALDWLERFDAWFADHGPMILVWILAVVVAVLVVYAARTRRARPGAGEA